MKKTILTVVCSLIATISANAFDAKSVLEKTASEFKKCPSVTVGYEVAIKEDTDNGTIILQGKKFMNNMSNTMTWFDGKTMWSYVIDNEEVNVTTPTASQLAKMNPYTFLDIYKKGYTVDFGKNTNDYYEVVLTANATNKSSIQKMLIHIGRHNYRPQYIMMGSTKANIEIKVTSYKKGKKLADTAFQFNKKKYPKADVIDLR